MRPRIALALVPLVGLLSATAPGDGLGLVVHEWGTFTYVAGSDGMPVSWRPLTGPPDLPSFVYRTTSSPLAAPTAPRRDIKPRLSALARLETPVVYFYADRDTTVSLRVGFPAGRITEWYPQADPAEAGIVWNDVEVRPGGAEAFPQEGAPSHYYAARETDAAPLTVPTKDGPQDEKFLFYRGVGNLWLPVWASVRGRRVIVQSLGGDVVPEVVLFESRGGEAGFSIAALGRGPIRLERPTGAQSIDALRRELERLLVRSGLFPREAEAMLATWGDSWFEEGLRLFYVLPRPATDLVLPLEIAPRPTAIARVLVGRLELIAPEDEARARAALASGADAAEIRARLGRFGEPLLRRVLDGTRDAPTRARIEALLEELER